MVGRGTVGVEEKEERVGELGKEKRKRHNEKDIKREPRASEEL